MRTPLAALAAVGAFVALAFGAAWFLTRAPGDAAAPAPLPPVALPEPPPLVPAPPTLPSQRVEPEPPPLLADPAPPPPPAGSWEAVTPVPRLAALGPLGGAIRRALNEAEPRLSACADQDVQARHGRSAPSQSGDGAGDEGTTPTVMLEIETTAGGARIVDAPLDTRGGAGDGLFSCVQRVLRGLEITHPAAKPGKRYRVPYSLLL